MSKRVPPRGIIDASPVEAGQPPSSKRDQLKQMIGQARLMEIIDQAYENCHSCDNCKALSDWWEEFGVQTAPANIMQRGAQRARR